MVIVYLKVINYFYQRNNNILVLIDGVEWNGVKLVSISPQNSHVTTFPVQTFTNLYSKSLSITNKS